MPSDSSRTWTRDRFYTIAGCQLPSVTTILDVIAKPALGPWYAKQERRYFETAMLEVLSKPGARDPEYVLSAVVNAVGGVKAADREKQRAATIGTAIHAGLSGSSERASAKPPVRSPSSRTRRPGPWNPGKTGRRTSP